jgi:hypothetical protein
MEDTLNIPLKKEFNEWLCENFTEGSSKSYISYVNSSLKLINEKLSENDIFEMINDFVSDKDNQCVEFILQNCISYVTKYCDDNVKSKYKNGLLQYMLFLGDTLVETDFNNSVENETISENKVLDSIKLKNEDLLFDSETLKNNFTFRLLTQDRIYGEVYFPISFIKKLFYQEKQNQKYFDSWVNNQIDNIKLYNEKSKIVSFKEIKNLRISTAKEVFFDSDNKTHVLYTENGYTFEMEQLKTYALRNVVIDHVKPMKDILSQNKEKLKALSKITEQLNGTKLLKGSGKELLKNVKKAGNFLIEKKMISSEDIDELKKDLEFLSTQIDLKLMCSKENLKKNKKTI